MKTYQLLARLGQPLAHPWHRLTQSRRRAAKFLAARRGTVIIVVLALLGMLALIGFFVFAFTSSENQSATYFTNSPSAKASTPTLNADAFFQDALRQIIMGPQASEKQTALWGGNKSLVPTMFGRDMSPYNGPGVNLFWNTTLNQASVDQNYNAKPDDGTDPAVPAVGDNRALTFLNLAPSAATAWQANTAFVTGAFVRPLTNNTGLLYIATVPGTSGGAEPTWGAAGTPVTDGGVTWVGATSLDLNNYPFAGNLFPDPDTNATYPDINSTFLAYDALVPNPATPTLPTRVMIPSFHRPQYLRNATAAGAAGANNVPVTNWYTDPLTASRVLFPHVEHACIDNNGNIQAATITVNGNTYNTQRFVTFTHPDTSSTAPAWGAGTAYTVGQIVQPSPASAANTSNFLCTQAGTSGATQPIWPTATGGTVTDGGAIWINTSIQPFGVSGNSFSGIPGDSNATTTIPATQEGVWTNAPWQPSTNYVLQAQVTPSPATGQAFVCTTAGQSGATQPTWPPLTAVPGTTVTDGTVVWTFFGPAINYMADTDGDGVPDAYYVDLGFPLMTAPGSSTQFVAMTAIRIIDADAYFNLNVHGNRSGSVTLGPAPIPIPFGGAGTAPNTTQFISKSNLGISASEVNPEWGFNAQPIAMSSDFPGNAAALATALQEYVSFFRSPAQSGTLPTDNHSAGNFELANMEWWNILNGRPQLTPSATPLTTPATVSGSSFPGRWGENTTRLDPIVTQVLAGTTAIQAGVAAGFGSPNGNDPFPLPGVSVSADNTQDDDNNQHESGAYTNTTTNVVYPAFAQPLDFFGAGSSVTFGTGSVSAIEGGKRLLIAEGQQNYPGYQGYFTNPTVLWMAPFGGALAPQGAPQLQINNADETFTEPAYVQTSDNIFSPSENVLQLSSSDFQNFGSLSRAATLAPFNLSSSARAAQIRQRFTSTSWDLKSFGKEFLGTYTGGVAPLDARRLWEFTDISGTGVGPYRFPPNFGTLTPGDPYLQSPVSPSQLYPLRSDLANLIRVIANPAANQAQPNPILAAQNLIMPQRPMSINGLVEQIQSSGSSTFRFRPLTPHPTSVANSSNLILGNTPIWDSSVGGSGSPVGIPFPGLSRPEQLNLPAPPAAVTMAMLAQQEWLARYDRQRLARDIYTLLYLTSGGNDTVNYATTSNALPVGGGPRPLYTDDQLQEMAQFAVNLVDQLDPDTNIAVFEYDKNLADGWNLDDNAYDGAADALPPFSIPALDRGVVYGVERQQLALNEAMVVFSQQCVNSASNVAVDHPDTQWDDTKQWSFLGLELENVGPFPVSFQNEQWQIAIKQSPIVTTPSLFYGSATSTPPNSGEMRLTFQSSQPQINPGPNARLTIAGMSGSANGTSYTLTNNNPSSGMPYPSYLVVDPNDKDVSPAPGPYAGTVFDNQFPIAPRAAYTVPNVGAPWTNSALTATNFLDLAQSSQANQYWVVPPNSTDPFTDGTPLSSASPPAPGTQLLPFNDPILPIPAPNILPTSAPIVLRIELRRRVDVNRAPVLPTDSNQVNEARDNPWIVVDHMDVPVSVLALKITGSNSDFAPQIQYQLGHLSAVPGGGYYGYSGATPPAVSTERTQPLYHDYTLNPFNSTSNPTQPNGPFIASSAAPYPRNGGLSTLVAPLWQGNSLGQDNDAAGYNPGTVPNPLVTPPTPPNPPVPTPIPPHPLYQPHNDRDFASIIELFNVPLWGPYGPQSLTTMNVPGVSSGNSLALSSGLAHLMATRTNEAGVSTPSALPPPEFLGGTDFIPADPSTAPKQHYNGYGVAGYRLQHPEGGGLTPATPASDFTENRWHRILGLVEVPTRSHRQLEEPNYVTAGSINGQLGFYRTPGKINLNTLRHPDVLAGLLDESDIYALTYSNQYPLGTPALSLLQVPLSLPDLNGDTVVNPPFAATPPSPANTRDWWLQFLTARDGVDPLPILNGGTNLTLPGLPRYPSGTIPPAGLSTGVAVTPGSHPFRGLGFSAYASAPGSATGGEDVNGYNGTLDSSVLRALTGDPPTPPTTTIPPNAPDGRRRIFEIGTTTDHAGDAVDYATRNRVLSKVLQNTTTRSNVFLVWIQIDFFQARDINPPNGVVRIGQMLPKTAGTPGGATTPSYRGFYVVDRSQAMSLMQQQYLPSATASPFVFSLNPSFNWQSLVLFQQRIQ
jgi:hypothetical protein